MLERALKVALVDFLKDPNMNYVHYMKLKYQNYLGKLWRKNVQTFRDIRMFEYIYHVKICSVMLGGYTELTFNVQKM